MALTGIDVSFYQGTIDWTTVANNNISFAILKATEGLDIVDPNFATNWAASRAVGMTRSAYHFFRAARDAKAQAEFFLKTVGKLEDFDLPLVLDLERVDGIDRNVALDKAQIWLDIVEKATGRKPIVYTYPVFWEEQLADTNRFVNYPLWIAHYQTLQPWIPGKWKNWTFHQYSETGQVKGIAGAVDLNQFAGTLDDLQKLLKGKICLRQGCAGNVVQELQTALKAAGFDVGTIDGNFGSKTKTAVMGFQQKNSLKPDGIVGRDTWTKIPVVIDGVKIVDPPLPLPPVILLDAFKNFKGEPHQIKAVEFLQDQIAKGTVSKDTTMKDFSAIWRNPTGGTSTAKA
jgi:lysozyme